MSLPAGLSILEGQLVINWRPRAAAHSDATGDDVFCSEGVSVATTLLIKLFDEYRISIQD